MKREIPVFYSHTVQEWTVSERVKQDGIDIPEKLIRKSAYGFVDLSEPELVRHYTALSTLNYGVDTGFYPLGSCTMKYNPKISERIASDPRWLGLHPWQDEDELQGMLGLLYDCEQALCKIFAYDAFTFQPAAGSHGEHTGLLLIRAYHKDRGEEDREIILVPDTAHGTNPASVAAAGYKVKKVKTDEQGNLDIEDLKKILGKQRIAGLMLTNPSTVGLFEENILEIANLIHKAGGLLYYDGANANALLGIIRPGDMGFDVCHLNLHKTFGTPHGGGGPGSGPVGVSEKLRPYLPVPFIKKDGDIYHLVKQSQKSIGRMHGFYGNINVIIKAYTYILMMGRDGLRLVSENAIHNANYIQSQLKNDYKLAFDRYCMHEFVLSASSLKKNYGVSALDIAKRLIDYGIHPPTIYFPLIVSESMMIEPTETESLSEIDCFISVMKKIAKEAATKPDLLKNAPQKAPLKRLNEAKAVKEPKLTA